MFSLNWNSVFLLCTVLFFKYDFIITAYDGVCDNYILPTMFCNCDIRHSGTTVSCWITDKLSSTPEVWRSIGNLENLIHLKLHPMKPHFFENIPSEGLKRLTSLKVLEIQLANLTELQSNAISDMSALQELNLDDNDIADLQRNAISKLPSLKKLSLRGNLLEEILAESLVGLLEVSELLLDRNKISRIEGCAFCDLQNLKDLELQNNQITDLTEYMFRGIRYLQRLDLFHNQIQILNDKVFHSLTRLLELDLRENKINHITPHAFQGLEQLQVLYLSSNQIKTLPSLAFQPLINLKDVQLLENSLESIEEDLIENIPKIKHIHFMMSFKGNPLKCDCRLKWVLKYLSVVESQHLRRELAELECVQDNSTQIVIQFLQIDCTVQTTIQTTSKTTVKAETTNSAKMAPIEIYRNDSDTFVGEEKMYDSSYVDEKEDIVLSDTEPLADSSGIKRRGNFLLCCSILTVFLIQRRERTFY